MKNSDIFNEYARIALEKGLISEGKQDAKSILEKTRRADSQSISDIAALYGVKPDQIKEHEYEKNIAEVAHPNAVVVSPSHDKLNGLVENINERQNILLNIVNKPVNGLHLYHKYAKEELVKSLIRTANHMDNIDEDELRILADDCIDGLKKEAFSFDDVKDFFGGTARDVEDVGIASTVGGAIGGLIGLCIGKNFAAARAGATIGSVATGGLSYIFSTGPAAKNVSSNAQLAINQIVKLIKDFPNKPNLKLYLRDLKDLKNIADQYERLIAQVGHEADQLRNDPSSHTELSSSDSQRAQSTGKLYISKLEKMSASDSSIQKFLNDVERNAYETSSTSDTMNRLERLFSPFKKVFGGTVHDAQRASQTLLEVIKTTHDKLQEAIGKTQTNYNNSQNAINQSSKSSQNGQPNQAEKAQQEEQERLSGQLDDHFRRERESWSRLQGK